MHAIDLNGQPLNLHFTLDCGQAFRWRKRDDDVWRGVVRDKLVALAVRDNVLYWHTYPEDDLALVQDYLRLDRDVNSIYAALSAADPHLKEVIKRFHGLRLLRQDPVETLLSFVCTAANNIPKVKRTIEELAQCQKQLVCENECAFPDPEALAAIEAMNVRSLVPQLGFRAKYLCAAAKYVADRGPEWLSGLRKASYEEALAELMRIKGIGRKIADCICLFALDKDEAVPVDTHVKQIAQRLFIPNLEAKALGPKVYASIVGAFHERYGPFAGWAQQFLFYEDLCKANGR